MDSLFEQYLKLFDYKLACCSKFEWSCWKDGWTYVSENEYGHVEATINPTEDIIYEVNVYSHKTKQPYRWLNPNFIDTFKSECIARRVEFDKAWDDMAYFDTESLDDIFDKVYAIFHDLDFDETVVINLQLDAATLLRLSMAAHSQRLTLNDYIVGLVKDAAAETLREMN